MLIEIVCAPPRLPKLHSGAGSYRSAMGGRPGEASEGGGMDGIGMCTIDSGWFGGEAFVQNEVVMSGEAWLEGAVSLYLGVHNMLVHSLKDLPPCSLLAQYKSCFKPSAMPRP